jgi:hypothetical protein
MLKKLLAAIGIGSAVSTSTPAQLSSGPYKDEGTNTIYHLLFCDRPELFVQGSENAESPWSILFAKVPDSVALRKIAEDSAQESRVRMLAYNALRKAGHKVEGKELLGVIVEYRMPGGLDTLAVFVDGRARYINQTGKMSIDEGGLPRLKEHKQKVIDAAKAILPKIGPWEKERLPAPKVGDIRMTFLASDGLSFGEGPMEVMKQEPTGAPLVMASAQLLEALVEEVLRKDKGD